MKTVEDIDSLDRLLLLTLYLSLFSCMHTQSVNTLLCLSFVSCVLHMLAPTGQVKNLLELSFSINVCVFA